MTTENGDGQAGKIATLIDPAWERAWLAIPEDYRRRVTQWLAQGRYSGNPGAVRHLTAVASGAESPRQWVIGDVYKLWKEVST